ncbi:MAG: hypothetical protein SVY53_10265 [Chloroflexota bacterium]|nr:hypothetical protein [Chloroflexota bacterium]
MALYDEVVDIAKVYLGPAADKFVTRQIRTHLNIESSQLSKQHLDELAHWCNISGALAMSEEKAMEFSNKVKALK